MMENDMKRNGSGYYDETPVKTGLFNNTPQAGEIWESTFGKEFLILKNHGGFCSTLALNDNPHEKTIEVISRTVRHTNPSMVGYSFNNCLSAFIKTVPEEKYLDIMQAVGERLGVTIRVSGAVEENQPLSAAWELERQDMIIHLDKLKAKCEALEAQNADLLADVETEHKQLKAERTQTDQAFQAFRAADEKATLYEKMYNALLDRLFARGEAK